MAGMARAVAALAALGLDGALAACADGRVMAESGPGGAKLTVTSMCLSGPIEGPIESTGSDKPARQGFFEGPSPMHAVADRSKGDTAYFSWTEDVPWGQSDAGSDGKIHVTKLTLSKSAPHARQAGEATYTGFMRASDLDITPEGKIGVLCAKHVLAWVDSFIEHMKDNKNTDEYGDDAAPLLLAVCEVDSPSMKPVGKPWRMGKAYKPEKGTFQGHSGAYPKSSWFEIRDNGYGWLTFAPHLRTWTSWYGATWGSHTGFAMHTYPDNATIAAEGPYAPWALTQAGVEYRTEDWPGAYGRIYSDYFRHGTGDHQMGSMTRYHPLIQDIAIVKHHHIPLYMQQYGLETPEGKFESGERGPGHKRGRVSLECPKKNDVGRAEGAIRPCGMGWIMGIATDKGNVCAKMSRLGELTGWEVIDPSLKEVDNLKQYFHNKLIRIATLGYSEAQSKCGDKARFLMGYVTADGKRKLVEVDGNCKKITEPWDVSAITTWPKHQEWTTTADGAVMWVTAWAKDASGKPMFNRWGTKPPSDMGKSRNNIKSYGRTTLWPGGADQSAGNEAQVTVYWPTARAGDSDPAGPQKDEGRDVCCAVCPDALGGAFGKDAAVSPRGGAAWPWIALAAAAARLL